MRTSVFPLYVVARLAFLTGMLIACCAVPARARQAAESIPACSRPVKVAISPIGRSMMVSSNGTVTGIVRDFLELVSQRSGCTFEYLVVPRARAFLMLETGEIDVVPSVNRTDQRDQWGKFVHLYNNRAMLIALKGVQPTTLAQLLDGTMTIGVVRGYDYGPAYMALLGDPRMQSRISVVRDPETCARMLAIGRMDAVLMAPSAFVEAAESLGITDKVIVTAIAGLPFVPTGLYFAQRRLDAMAQVKLQGAIDALAKRGEYAHLLEKYYAIPRWALGNLKTNPSNTQAAR